MGRNTEPSIITEVLKLLDQWDGALFPRNGYAYGKEGEVYLRRSTWPFERQLGNLTIREDSLQIDLATISIYESYQRQGITRRLIELLAASDIDILKLELIHNQPFFEHAQHYIFPDRTTIVAGEGAPSIYFVSNSVIVENRQNPILYHGSPYGGLENLSKFEGRREMLFLTPSPSVAEHYTSILLSSGQRPKKMAVKDQKTIYTFNIDLPEEVVFDTRKPEHRKLYYQIRNELKEELEPEDWPSKDLMFTPDLPDSDVSTYGQFPDFGSGLNIRSKLKELGFRAMWVSEGSQGASLGLFYPQDAELLNMKILD